MCMSKWRAANEFVCEDIASWQVKNNESSAKSELCGIINENLNNFIEIRSKLNKKVVIE